MKLISLLAAAVLLAAAIGLRADEHGEEGEIRPGGAVLEADEERGLRLSDKALAAIGVKLAAVSQAGTQAVPAEAVVYFQDEVGVYRLRGGWFKLVHVALLAKDGRTARIVSEDLKPGDRIAIAGAALLRVAELDALGGGGEGHGH